MSHYSYLKQKKNKLFNQNSDKVYYISIQEDLPQENTAEKRTVRLWTDEEKKLILGAIQQYRIDIKNRDELSVKRITREYAFKLKEYTLLLSKRSKQAINEHISYLGDLLARVGTEENYAKKTKNILMHS